MQVDCCEFFDLPLAAGELHFPSLAALDQRHLVAADQKGRVWRVDLEQATVAACEWLGGLESLRYGQFSHVAASAEEGRRRCLLANRTPTVFLLEMDAEEPTRLESNSGPANTACFSPEGDRLALGLGRYPLDDGKAEARLEVWDVANQVPVQGVALPGVVVDAVHWNGRIVCAVQGVNQHGGYLVRLDEESLLPLSFHPHPFQKVRTVLESEGTIVIGCEHGVVGAPLEDLGPLGFPGKRMWTMSARSNNEYPCFADDPDGEYLVTNDAQIVDLRKRQLCGALPELDGCFAVSRLARNRFAGVSLGGVLRVWTLELRRGGRVAPPN